MPVSLAFTHPDTTDKETLSDTDGSASGQAANTHQQQKSSPLGVGTSSDSLQQQVLSHNSSADLSESKQLESQAEQQRRAERPVHPESKVSYTSTGGRAPLGRSGKGRGRGRHRIHLA